MLKSSEASSESLKFCPAHLRSQVNFLKYSLRQFASPIYSGRFKIGEQPYIFKTNAGTAGLMQSFDDHQGNIVVLRRGLGEIVNRIENLADDKLRRAFENRTQAF